MNYTAAQYTSNDFLYKRITEDIYPIIVREDSVDSIDTIRMYGRRINKARYGTTPPSDVTRQIYVTIGRMLNYVSSGTTIKLVNRTDVITIFRVLYWYVKNNRHVLPTSIYGSMFSSDRKNELAHLSEEAKRALLSMRDFLLILHPIYTHELDVMIETKTSEASAMVPGNNRFFLHAGMSYNNRHIAPVVHDRLYDDGTGQPVDLDNINYIAHHMGV